MRHRSIILIALLILTTGIISASSRYATTAAKADRSFDGEEWASAAALYELMLDERPDTANVYARAIVSYDMINDTTATIELLERAMSHNISYTAVLRDVQSTFRTIGFGTRYGDYLNRLWQQFSWMRRALDHELLEYHTFRNDGEMMVKYASELLVGLPDSIEYLHLLAKGYLLNNDTDRAIEVWKSILKINPDNYDALLYLGNYMALNNRNSEASEYLSHAYRLRPTPHVASTLEKLTNTNL